MNREYQADWRIDGSHNRYMHDMMGAHRLGAYVVFRFSAPEAYAVYLVGSFNFWGESLPMTPMSDGIWEARIESHLVPQASTYKYKAYMPDRVEYYSDPYAENIDDSEYHNSVFCSDEPFEWEDDGWMSDRNAIFGGGCANQPMSIYALDPLAWRSEATDGESLPNVARELIPYVKQMGYTHIKIPFPIQRYVDQHSGRDNVAFFALDKSYCSTYQLMELINSVHRAGIGVITEIECCEESRSFDWKPFCSGICSRIEKYHFDGVEIKCDCDDLIHGVRSLVTIIHERFSDVFVIASGQAEGIYTTSSDVVYGDRPFGAFDEGKDGSTLVGLFDNVDTEDNDRAEMLSRAKVTSLCRTFIGGKKLTCAGEELGVFLGGIPQWPLLDKREHAEFQLFCAELGYLYMRYSLLWSGSASRITPTGVFPETFVRKNDYSGELLMMVNPLRSELGNAKINVDGSAYRIIFTTDGRASSGRNNKHGIIHTDADHNLSVIMPPFSVIILERAEK